MRLLSASVLIFFSTAFKASACIMTSAMYFEHRQYLFFVTTNLNDFDGLKVYEYPTTTTCPSSALYFAPLSVTPVIEIGAIFLFLCALIWVFRAEFVKSTQKISKFILGRKTSNGTFYALASLLISILLLTASTVYFQVKETFFSEISAYRFTMNRFEYGHGNQVIPESILEKLSQPLSMNESKSLKFYTHGRKGMYVIHRHIPFGISENECFDLDGKLFYSGQSMHLPSIRDKEFPFEPNEDESKMIKSLSG